MSARVGVAPGQVLGRDASGYVEPAPFAAGAGQYLPWDGTTGPHPGAPLMGGQRRGLMREFLASYSGPITDMTWISPLFRGGLRAIVARQAATATQITPRRGMGLRASGRIPIGASLPTAQSPVPGPPAMGG